MNNKYNIDEDAIDKRERANRESFYELFKNSPIPENEILRNLGLYINRQSLSRIIFFQELYLKLLDVQGIIIEFGTRWGQNLALFESFRGMYEPYNFKRKIVGFDTFAGFENTNKKDGTSELIKKGAYSVSEGYQDYLSKILDYHENESPIPHIKKYQLIKGNASITCKEYFEKNPQTIVAFAYFDLDIYKPTKDCLDIIKNHVTKGSIIGFDQLNDGVFPGETIALKEVFDLDRYKIRRHKLNPDPSYIIID